MGDGFQLHDGKFLVDAAGFAAHSDCCCECPTCAERTARAISTVVGGGCAAWCQNYARNWGLVTGIGLHPNCVLRWDHTVGADTWQLFLEQNGAIWTARTIYNIFQFDFPVTDVTADITWAGCLPSGSFSIPGQGVCAGCTLNVTLSGV